MADADEKRCKYIDSCTLYRAQGRSGGEYSALSKDVRRKMCENVSVESGKVPCVPGTAGIGGGGVTCEAYFARSTIEDLLKKAVENLSNQNNKEKPGLVW